MDDDETTVGKERLFDGNRFLTTGHRLVEYVDVCRFVRRATFPVARLRTSHASDTDCSG